MNRNSSSFWGMILLLAGLLLLASNLGWLDFLGVPIWDLIWPLVLIGFGLWIVWGVTVGKPNLDTQAVSVPLENAHRAHVEINHGAGRLNLHSDVPDGHLISGTFEGGLDYKGQINEDLLKLTLRTPSHLFGPWNWHPGLSLDWNFGLSRALPLTLHLNSGASNAHINLSELQVSDLKIETGASALKLTLPAHASYTHADINGGAASFSIQIPEGVAARIKAEVPLVSTNVNTQRFPKTGTVYQSPDYETKANKIDLVIKMGVGSLSIQ